MENITKKTKKFIFASPLQPEAALRIVNYRSIESSLLKNDLFTRFPIIVAINAYVEENDEIEIITILTEYENAKRNYEFFKQEIEELKTKRNFKYKITEISTPYDETIKIHLQIYSGLISLINDNEIIYACITYGTNPTPIVEIMALNYAYKLRKNTDIGCIVYGRLDHSSSEEPKPSYIHDVSPLFFMDAISNTMSQLKLDDPAEKIKALLEIDT